MASTKKYLKMARICLDSEDYEEALRYCQKVLEGGENHLAYLTQAKVYLKTNKPQESLQSLKLAQQLETDHLLTMLALIAYQEKYPGTGDSLQLLAEGWARLLHNQEFGDKKIEIFCKLAGVYEKQSLYTEMDQLVKELLSQALDLQQQAKWWTYLLGILLPKPSKTDEMLQMIERGLKFVTSREHSVSINSNDLAHYFKEYITLLMQMRRLPEALSQAQTCCSHFPEVGEYLELLVKIQVELYLEHQQLSEDLAANTSLLLDLSPNSPQAFLASGILAYTKESFKDAASLLEKGLKNVQGMPRGWILLARSKLRCSLVNDAEKHAEKAYQHAKFMNEGEQKNEVQGDIWLCMASISAARRSWHLCSQHLEKALKFLSNSPEVLGQIAHIYLLEKKISEVEKICTLLEPESPVRWRLEGEVYISQGKFDQAEEVLNKLPATDALGQHLLGKLHFLTGRSQAKAIEHLAQSIQQGSSYCARNYFYLGCIYQARGDIQKACQFMAQGVALDPNDDEIGLCLADLQLEKGDKDSCLETLQYIAELANPDNCLWAFKRLAGLHYDKGNFAEASHFIQKALQLSPNDGSCWVLLGDIYIEMEYYKAAIKAFQKAMELEDSSLYPSYRIGHIHQLQHDLDSAIAIYESLLVKDASYLPVFRGLAECYLAKARRLIDEGSSMRAKELLEKCFSVMDMMLSADPSHFYYWYLYSKLNLLASRLDVQWFPLEVGTHGVAESNSLLLQLAERSSVQALELEPLLGSLWYSLGLCYFLQWRAAGEEELLRKSLACVKGAIASPEPEPCYWSLLGIVASQAEAADLPLAQHAFIRAIELDSNVATHWCNLSVFYMEQGNVELSQKVIKVAECEDPEQVEVWIVQGLLAKLSELNLLALENFFHASELDNHAQAHLGFGYHLLKMLPLMDSSSLKCQQYLHQCEAALLKYTDRHSKDAMAWTMLSLIQERLTNHKAALSSISRASHLAAESDDTDQQEICSVNLARILWQNGWTKEALEVWQHLTHLSDPLSLCFQALLEHETGNPVAAVELYTKAIQSSTEDKLLGQIFTALAFVIYQCSGSEEEAVKYLSGDYISVEGLLALYALAILDKNQEVAQSVYSKLAELEVLENPQLRIFQANLIAYDHILLKGDLAGCQHYVTQYCLDHPHSGPAALMAANHMLRLQKWDAAATFVSKALAQGSRADSSLALGQLLMSQFSGALQSAHSAVINNPEDCGSWLALLSASIPPVLLGHKSPDVIYRLFDICFSLVPEQQNQEVHLWLHLTRIWLTLALGNTSKLPDFFSQAGDNDYVTLLKSYADSGKDPLLQSQHLFSWIVKACFLSAQLEETLTEAMRFAEENQQLHWLPLLQSHLAVRQLQLLKEGLVDPKTLYSCITQLPRNHFKAILLIRFHLYNGNQKKMEDALRNLVFYEPGNSEVEKVARTVLYNIYKEKDDKTNLQALSALCLRLDGATPDGAAPDDHSLPEWAR